MQEILEPGSPIAAKLLAGILTFLPFLDSLISLCYLKKILI